MRIQTICRRHNVAVIPETELKHVIGWRGAWTRIHCGVSVSVVNEDNGAAGVYINPRGKYPVVTCLHEIGHCRTKLHPNRMVRERRAWRWAYRRKTFTDGETAWMLFCLLTHQMREDEQND